MKTIGALQNKASWACLTLRHEWVGGTPDGHATRRWTEDDTAELVTLLFEHYPPGQALADLPRLIDLGYDPAQRQVLREEVESAIIIEQRFGVRLQRIEPELDARGQQLPQGDFIGDDDLIYEVIGGRGFAADVANGNNPDAFVAGFENEILRHIATKPFDWLVIDLGGLVQPYRQRVLEFVSTLDQSVRDRTEVVRIRFEIHGCAFLRRRLLPMATRIMACETSMRFS